jgi:hypothetical protein
MKVLMDDCRSVKESEVSFNMNSVSPNFGSVDGDNYIYIYGDFPYAASSEYEQAGLVAHYDGINNTGQGDKYHSRSTDSWVNLVDPSLPLVVTGIPNTAAWTSNGWRDDAASMLQTPTYVPDTWPDGNDERTAEIIYITPPYELKANTEAILFRYGPMYLSSNDAKKGFYISYRGGNMESFLPIAIADYNNFVTYAKTKIPELYKANTLHTVTSTYGNNMNDPAKTNMIVDGVKVNESYVKRSDAVANTVRDYGKVGADGSTGGTLVHDFLYHSVRLYDRILSEEEITRNAERDQRRYIAPPTVTIDDIQCPEVVVLSPHFLMCKVPAGTIGAKDIKIKVNDKGTEKTINYAGAYEYVDSGTAFYISEIFPIVSPAAGEGTLTLTGNLLGTISEVMIGDAVCSSAITQANDTYECPIPAHLPGEVDIMIKLNGGMVYRFAKVFEYQ